MGQKKSFSIIDLYLLMAMVIWGSDFLFAKIALREISPMNFAAMRTFVSTAVIAPFFFLQQKDWSVPLGHFIWLGGLAFLGTFVNRIFWSVGLNLTTASNSALIGATSPIFVLLASYAVYRTEVTFRATVGIFISFLGIILVIRGDGEGWALSSQTLQGDLLIIGAAIVWALFTVLAKPLLKEYSSLKVTTYVMILSSIFFLPYLPNEKGNGWGEISGLAWFSVLYVGILGNGLAYFLWVVGIQRIGPLRTILYQYLMPVTAIFCAVPFLHETLTALQIGGAAVVFGGIFLARSG